jgi:alpha-L-rhamnosidase
MPSRAVLPLLLLLGTAGASSSSSSFVPFSLLSEHLPSPALGLGTLAPRLSWQLLPTSPAPPPRNVTQLAYQLQAASTPSLLLANTPDVCDSGQVASSLSAAGGGVPFCSPLLPGQTVYWRVRVWMSDAPDAPTPYAPVDAPFFARFSVGLQGAADWSPSSAFVGLASAASEEAPWLRSPAFTLDPALVAAVQALDASALLYVASVGYHEAYVNGVRLEPEAVLLPSVTDLGARIPVHTYDVSAALVAAPGDNVVGLWVAPGWAIFHGGNPVTSFNVSKPSVVQAELRISAVGGGGAPLAFVLSTNTSWAATNSTTSHNGNWRNSDFGGDIVNVTAVPPAYLAGNGWATTAVDASAWEAATAYPEAAAGRVVTPESLEPTGVIGVVAAISVDPCPAKSSAGSTQSSQSSQSSAPAPCFLVTFAELFTGWVNFTLPPLRPGTGPVTLTLQHSTNAGTTVEFNQVDLVTLPGAGSPYPPSAASSFQPRFSYHETHYVTVTGLDPALLASPLTPSAFTGVRLMSARPRRGSFSASLPLLTSIYETTARNYEGLTAGGMTVDCPHRERLGYGGDGHTSLEFALATYASGAFFRKVARDWADVRGWDGTDDLPHTAPTIDGGGGPAWGGYAVTMPWRVYEVTGDERILVDAYPTMVRFLSFLEGNVDNATGLLTPFGGSWGFLGDWITPHGSEESGTPESVLFNSCYLAYALRLASGVAAVLNDTARAASFNASADAVAAGVHAKFFNATTGAYLDGRQTHQALPLVAGVVPPALLPTVRLALQQAVVVGSNGPAQAGHFDTGLHGTYFLTRLLSNEAGVWGGGGSSANVSSGNSLLYLMASQTTFPSYGDFLAKNYTTWPEDWGGAPSRMHGCFNGIGLWFSQGLLGVRPGAPGYSLALVRPAFGVGNITWAQGVVPTPFGDVSVGWTAAGGGGGGGPSSLTLSLSVPANSAARVWIPASGPAAVTEGGQPASAAAGVSFVGMDGDGMTVWAVASGVYAFAV